MKSRYLPALALVVLGGCAPSPEDTVRAFFRAVEAQDHDAAIQLLHPNALKYGDAKLRVAIAVQGAHIGSCGGLSGIAVDLAPGSGSERRGTATLSYKGACKADKEPVRLAKLGDRWRFAL